MTRHEATFSVDEPSDAHAARRMLAALHDAVREETRGDADGEDVLAAFAALQDATTPPAPGRLTVTFEREDGGFED